MAKLTLTDLASLTNQTSAISTINNNNTATETALEKTLSRDGTSPNEMEATLDMNSNRIINLPEPEDDTEPIRKIDLDEYEPPAWFQGPKVETVTTSTFTVTTAYAGYILRFSDISGCTVTLKKDLPENFLCVLQRTLLGGQVTVAFESGSTNDTPGGANKIITAGHMATVFVDSNSSGTNASFVLQGNIST